MQDKLLYEYAVIRIVPRVEREEFFNVGVIMYLHKTRKLLMHVAFDEVKLSCLCREAEPEMIRQHLHAFELVALGGKDSGPIGMLDAASRFRWLTAPRSTIVQTSRVHPGFCNDAKMELQKLFEQYVSD